MLTQFSEKSSKIVPLGAPFLIFSSQEDQVEGLSVCGIDTCSIDGAVRKHDFQ